MALDPYHIHTSNGVVTGFLRGRQAVAAPSGRSFAPPLQLVRRAGEQAEGMAPHVGADTGLDRGERGVTAERRAAAAME